MEGALAHVPRPVQALLGRHISGGWQREGTAVLTGCLQHSHDAAEDFPPLPALLSCAEMQFEGDDSSSIMGRQEKQLFLSFQETSRVGHLMPPVLLGFPATDEQDLGAVTWLM